MAEINTNLDTTPLPPNNLVAKDPQSAELAGYVRTKTFGRDVRESIARSIELNSTRSKSAETLANETLNVANDLTARYDVQVGALTKDSEVIDARGGKTILGQRLDEADTQLERNNNQLNSTSINAMYPPSPLVGLKMDGETDETVNFQNLLDYVESLGGGTLYLPKGVLIHTLNFAPENVTILGSGVHTTRIKLADGAVNQGQIRQQLGLYPKYNINYFGVSNLTYDGNAQNNIDFDVAHSHDNYAANGLANTYFDPNVDMYTQTLNIDPLATAKDFKFSDLHIINTIRNSILINGINHGIGTVKDVVLENAILDHFIYESGTNVKVNYDNVTTKGIYRGAGIVAANGVFKGIKHINPLPNPIPDLWSESYFNFRNFNLSSGPTEPSISDVSIDFLASDINSIIIEKQGTKYTINHIKVKQVDESPLNNTGVPVGFIHADGGNKVTVRDVEFENVMAMILLTISTGSNNHTLDTIKYNYNPLRNELHARDALVVLRHTNNGQIRNVSITNVDIDHKAPKLFYGVSTTGTGATELINIKLDDINLKSTIGTPQAFDMLHVEERFSGKRNLLLNSELSGYAAVGLDHARVVRDDLNFDLKDSFFNDIPSTRKIVLAVPEGSTTFEVDFPYIMARPRVVNVSGYTRPQNIPKITIKSAQMTLTWDTPTTAYEEIYISTEF